MTICLSCGRLAGYGVTCQHCGAPAPSPARLEARMIHVLDVLAKDKRCWCLNNMGEHSSVCEEVRVFYDYLQARLAVADVGRDAPPTARSEYLQAKLVPTPSFGQPERDSGQILSPDLRL